MDADRNLAAFLCMIRACEGTDSEDGYRALFGYRPGNGHVFVSFADHPRIKTAFKQTDGTVSFTTAAGAYQFLVRTWDVLKDKLHLPDFGPASQDRAATELIRECNALADVRAGNLVAAIERCSRLWASLPASYYKQPKRSYEFASNAFVGAGGVIA